MAPDQPALADRIDSSNIRSRDGGRTMQSARRLVGITEALNITPSELLEGVRSGG